MENNPVKLKIKKLHPNAVIPKYAKPGDAGMDLTVVTGPKFVSNTEEGYAYIEYGTGLAMDIPEGYVGLVFPRSSVSKTALILANAVGVVDSGYRGEVSLRFKLDGTIILAVEKGEANSAGQYKTGERAAQLVIMKLPLIEVEEVNELTETERGTGGFGSSGQ